MHLKTKGQSLAPPELMRWSLAERFGWTLEYVDNLKMSDVNDFIRITDARHKAR